MYFRQAVVWQKAMRMAERACRAAAGMRPRERFIIGTQMTRGAISVASNVAEGWDRESRKEKAHFLAIAQGSLDELETQLELCRDLHWLDETSVEAVFGLSGEVGRMLTALRRQLRAPAANGPVSSS